MLQVKADVVLLAQRIEQLAGDFAKVDVGADRYAGGSKLLPRLAAFHHQRYPLLDLLRVFGIFHATEQRTGLQGGMALLEELDVVITPDKAHVRHVVDKRRRIVQHLAFNLIGPELFGNLEGLVDCHRLADIDAAIGQLGGVVQLAEGRVAGAGVVPSIGAFIGDAVEAFVNVDAPAGLQFIEVGAQAGTHDAAANQQNIHGFFRLGVLGAADHAQAQQGQ